MQLVFKILKLTVLTNLTSSGLVSAVGLDFDEYSLIRNLYGLLSGFGQLSVVFEVSTPVWESI